MVQPGRRLRLGGEPRQRAGGQTVGEGPVVTPFGSVALKEVFVRRRGVELHNHATARIRYQSRRQTLRHKGFPRAWWSVKDDLTLVAQQVDDVLNERAIDKEVIGDFIQ